MALQRTTWSPGCPETQGLEELLILQYGEGSTGGLQSHAQLMGQAEVDHWLCL